MGSGASLGLKLSPFALLHQSSSVVLVTFVVVFVAERNAAHRSPCGDDSLSYYNVICHRPISSFGSFCEGP